ncbi:GST-like protein [Bradyrhizobium sp. USDA 4011]
MKLELYGAKTGNCLRAAVALSEAGLSYQVRSIDIAGGEQRGQAFKRLNPTGKIPVLLISRSPDVEALAISQSSAIMFFADQQAPGRLLPAVASPSRAKVLEAFFYFTSEVIGVNGIAFNLFRGGYTDAAGELTQRYLTSMIESERFLSQAGFMGGDDFSLADIAGYTVIRSAADTLPWERLPRLAAWRDRIAQRPGLQRGMAAFDAVSGS